MARIIFSGYVVRYPLGGMVCNNMQWLCGLQRLGHEVYLVEKADYSDACYNPISGKSGNDPAHGFAVISRLLAQFGLESRLCFVDYHGRSWGLPHSRVKELFRGADLYIDYGNHGAWLPEAAHAQQRILVDGEPGYRHIKLAKAVREGRQLLVGYDRYCTVGLNIGTRHCLAPTGGLEWHPVLNPVVVDMFKSLPAQPQAPFTTVMNWQAHEALPYQGAMYGQKDIEFEKFLELPRRVAASLEVAVAGTNVPVDRLRAAGWRIKAAHDVTRSLESFEGYIRHSQGEFSVAKNVFVAMNTGWFSDRSACYLASGRPVVLQDTGFGAHLPCGRGLFAVRDVDEAAAAIDAILSDPPTHARAAREVAETYLDARVCLSRLLEEVGL